MSNYPDDIRSYDNDPRSPFYNGPDDEAQAEAAREYILNDSDIHSEKVSEQCYFSDLLVELEEAHDFDEQGDEEKRNKALLSALEIYNKIMQSEVDYICQSQPELLEQDEY